MNFLAPAAFAFAAAIPVVILFYLLKRRRMVRLVSSTVLWQRFLAETQASAPFQKLRKNWLLLLQILLLVLAVLALARPYFSAPVKPAHLRVIVLDASASMLSTDESPTRFEKARSEALKWVDALAGNDRMVVLLAGAMTEVKQSATSEKAALRRALAGCSPTHGPTRLVPALKMAESLVRDQPGAEIHLFSDGAVPELREFENKALPLIYHRMGLRGNNAGIVALDVRANPENARQRAVYVSVANSSSNRIQSELQCFFGERLLETRPVTIEPGETSPQVFIAAQPADGVFKLKFAAPDDLLADNEASLPSLLPKPIKVLLVSPGNRFLERALRSVANVQLAVTPSLTDPAAAFDFVVLDGVQPQVWPSGNVLAFNIVNTNWFPTIQRLESPAIVDWRSTHPLLRYVAFDSVQVAESFSAKAPGWAISLVDSPQAPLILAGELNRQRLVWVGFDPLNSNWPLRISFPIFIANTAEWLNPASALGGQLMVKAGEAFRLPLARPVDVAEITTPDGIKKRVALDPKANELVFAETFLQGVYQVAVDTNTVTFCVNLLDASESNTTPQEALKLGTYEQVKATTARRANMEIWRSIAGLGLLMLLIEWWYYHRRTA